MSIIYLILRILFQQLELVFQASTWNIEAADWEVLLLSGLWETFAEEKIKKLMVMAQVTQQN